MKRQIENELQNWKDHTSRKPLIIRGPRQVGKTYIVNSFAEKFSSYIEINFELQKEVKKIFTQDLYPERIIRDLSLLLKQKIVPGETLLFLDEIQECPEAITSLRYFYEKLPELHVIAAGSLLEFEMEKTGIPVGRVSTIYMYPLSFNEFIQVTGNSGYIGIIDECINQNKINEAHHNKLMKLLGEYLAVGGMPESVKCWIETGEIAECYKILRGLVETYRQLGSWQCPPVLFQPASGVPPQMCRLPHTPD